MSKKEQEVMQRIREHAHRTLPVGAKAILYGSHARGDAHPGSDWDVLILLQKNHLDDQDYIHVSYPFVMLGCELDEEINPIMYTEKEWDQYYYTPFHENVMHDGILL